MMELSDLVVAGRLSFQVDKDGFIPFKRMDKFVPALLRHRDVFLIFSNQRVFYVTIAKVKQSLTKISLRFEEDDVAVEVSKHRKVLVAWDPLIVDQVTLGPDYVNPVGFTAWNQMKEIGIVSAVSTQKSQRWLIINDNEKEYMIPEVEQYIQSIDIAKRTVVLQNVDELLTL